jgi:hypothetical protein
VELFVLQVGATEKGLANVVLVGIGGRFTALIFVHTAFQTSKLLKSRVLGIQ